MTAIVDIIGRGSSTAAAIPRSRSTSSWTTALGRAAVPSGASTGAHEARRAARRRRSAISAKACSTPSKRSTARSCDAICGMDAEDQVAHRPRHDRARRHAEQEPARRQRDPRRLARGRQGRGQRRGLPLYRYLGGVAAQSLAGADDEHPQRRRACRQTDRFPGIHDRARGRAHPSPRPAHGRRRFSTRSRRFSKTDHDTNVGDEGGFAPNLHVERGGAGPDSARRSKRPGTAGRRCHARARRGGERVLRRRRYRLRRAKARSLGPSSMVDYLRALANAIPIVSIEDGMAEDDYGRLEALDAETRRQGPARRRRRVRDQR